MSLSNYLETALFNHVYRNTAYTSPTTVYVGLFTSNPGEAGSGTEVSGGSYARKAVTFGAPTDGVGSNSAPVTFDEATADWGDLTHFATFDASSAGNMLSYDALSAPKTIDDGDTAFFDTGDLVASFA
ncbi:MAG: hypothetical protein ACEQSX_12855 [Baekduiaceae bacterium]